MAGSDAEKQTKLFFIGYIGFQCNEFGFDPENPEDFSICPNKEIKRIFTSHKYCIYSDETYQNIWAAGCNDSGECGIHSQINPVFTPITFFKCNNIDIKQIFVSIAGNCTFFKSDNNKIYACGRNNNAQIGWNTDEIKEIDELTNNAAYYENDVYIPRVITDLEGENVIDIQTSTNYSIALCSSNNQQCIQISMNWCRIYKAPQDVTNILILFLKSTQVLATTGKQILYGSGHAQDAKFTHKYGWNEVEIFKNKTIIQIAAGEHHTLFLEENGVVWSCGDCSKGRTGNIYVKKTVVFVPREIKYFVDRGIEIKSIACGSQHNMAIDVNGRLYGWGSNEKLQCGIDVVDDVIMEPTMIEFFKKFVVDEVKCGMYHNTVRTNCGKYFLFGSDDDNECMTFDEGPAAALPNRIDELVKNICNVERIIDVIPGWYNTKIICV